MIGGHWRCWGLTVAFGLAPLLFAGCPQQEASCLNCAPDLRQDVSEEQDLPSPTDGNDAVIDPVDPTLPHACDEIYSVDHLPTFEITISPAAWDALLDEYYNWDSAAWDARPLKQYQPLAEFRYEDELIAGAAIRLKGNPMHWFTGKMQFNISFKQYDEGQRFHGLRKLNLDAPHCDPAMMHDRLGMSLFHDLGLPAPCCNHVRLVVNGEYYGLFANIEHVDQEFLERNFGHHDEGNLYKFNEKKTHESDPDVSDLQQFEAALALPALESLVDLNQALLFWATEAVIPQLDGYVVGGINYYLYNHPQSGFLFIPWDLDYSFEVDAEHTYYDVDPATYEVGWGHGKPNHMLTVFADDAWRIAYHEALAVALEAYDPQILVDRLATWEEQIFEALEEDPNSFFAMDEHEDRLNQLQDFIVQRAEYVEGWLACKGGASYEQNTQDLTLDGANYSLWLTRCNWDDAEQRCQALGGHLALPGSDEEQEFLVTQLLELEDENWWIGLTDAPQEGLWRQPDGSPPFYSAWNSTQPDGGPEQNCAVIANNLGGQWNDKSCAEQYPSVCLVP